MSDAIYCRCCGKRVYAMDRYPVHTNCIGRHWSKHCFGVNASRCKEFKPGSHGVCSVCGLAFVVLSGPSIGCAVHGIRAPLSTQRPYHA